ncbi:MAG: DUF6056 family protein [bacterium]
MQNKQIQVYSEKFLIALLLLLILPFLLLYLYLNPTPEDFYFAYEAKHWTLWEDMRIQYKNATGRYFQIILLYLNPLAYNSFPGYKIVCFLLMVLLIYAIFLSAKLLSKDQLTFREIALISLIIFFLYLYAMPIISEGLYWYTGITAYNTGVILIPFFFLFSVLLHKSKKLYLTIFYTLISCVLIFAIGGSNEILSPLFFIFIIIWLISDFLAEKKLKWTLIVFVLIAGVSLYLLAISPGNRIRSSQFPGNRNLIFAFSYTFTFLIQKIFSWVFNSPLIPCTLFLIPVFSGIIKKNKNITKPILFNPVWSMLIWLGFLYISTFIPLWSSAQVFDRTLNFIYLLFLAGWFYNVFILYNFVSRRYNLNLERHIKYVYIFSFVVLSYFLIKENSIKTAYYDLLGGSASGLNSQMQDRYEQIRQCSSDSCEVDSLKNIPRTLFIKDITSDPNVLSSGWYGKYFNKEIITLKR